MKQAIVVIHGVGEQKPMDTVRGFVEAVMPIPANPAKPKFWTKPDPMSELFELRKLTCPQSDEIPPTDFYEYYWAYQPTGTRFVHILSWALSVLVRLPSNVPRHLRVLWLTLWLLLLTFAAAASMSSSRMGHWMSLGQRAIATNQVIALLSSALLLVITGFILNYVGDAARYLNPRPPNIRMRRRIRAEGTELLRHLHACGEYNRVVLVGHSLGSVIAYDILKNFWLKCNTCQEPPTKAYQDALRQLQETGTKLAEKPSDNLAREFRRHQTLLWEQLREINNPWLVTDLVTVGSPLAHAALLLAATKAELLERQIERELPTCPPVPDDGRYWYSFTRNTGGREDTIFPLHHAALFACTCWTNLYFPAALGFFGDLVGGPLRSVLGQGIQDIVVDSLEWGGWPKHLPLIHTHYWSEKTSPQEMDDHPWALVILRKALGLESRNWLEGVQASQDRV